MFRTLAIAILWKNSQIFWNNWSKFHIALLIPFFPVKKLSKTDRIRGFWVMAILSIFWNFMTRRSQEFMDYLPLICNKSLLFYFTLLLPCSLTCSYNICHWFVIKVYSFILLFYSLVRWLVVTIEFSSKWWRHENTIRWLVVTIGFSSKWWHHENTMQYILSIFQLISIFRCATMILKSDFMFVESLHWYEIILELLQFWCAKRVFQIKCS